MVVCGGYGSGGGDCGGGDGSACGGVRVVVT